MKHEAWIHVDIQRDKSLALIVGSLGLRSNFLANLVRSGAKGTTRALDLR